MDLRAAEEMAWKLMTEHGMRRDRWVLKWDNRTTRAGACRLIRWSATMGFSHGVIYLSRHITAQHSEAEVRNTILHEIAHAMTPNSCAPHGPEWRANARKVGAQPKATFDGRSLTTKFVGTCPNGHTTNKNRRTKASCAKCSKVYDPRFLFVWTESGAPAPVLRPVATSPVPVYTPEPVRRSAGVAASRAAAYDAGTAFIDWD